MSTLAGAVDDLPRPIIARPCRPAHPVADEGLAAAVRLAGAATSAGPAAWALPVLTGDLALQYAVEQLLGREGLDRAAIGREEFAARAAQLEVEQVAAAAATAALSAPGGVTQGAAGPDPAAAARTAFVTLYENGLLDLGERVVASCPRCETVVGPGDAEPVADEQEVAVVVLPLQPDGAAFVEVVTEAPELMDAVAAVVVPPGTAAAGQSPGTRLELPLGGRQVPVLVDDAAAGAYLLLPAHHVEHWEIARRAGLSAPVVMTVDGVITEGRFEGMARYAARAQALEALSGEGRLAGVRRAPGRGWRCRLCGTTLVERLGAYWFLTMAPLAGAAAERLAAGSVTMVPGSDAPALAAALAGTGDWCVSRQLWAGPAVPVGWCLDCGKPTVAVGEPHSCGICMGGLEPDGSTLDGRFVAASWAAELARECGGATLVAGRDELADWLAPALALVGRLAGEVPLGAALTGREAHGDPLGAAAGGR